MSLHAIVLAAGKGTRLQSDQHDLPKVLRQAAGKPLIGYVLDALAPIPAQQTTIVVGYKKEAVISAFPGYQFAVQEQQLGTGHAVMSAKQALINAKEDPVLVCCGDMPLLQQSTYAALIKRHVEEQNACTLLSGTTHHPLPFGRIVRDNTGAFDQIVEDRDCTAEQQQIRELNAGVYVFSAQLLLRALDDLRADNSQAEYYLTDVPAILKSQGEKIGICMRELGDEILGVNTQEDLAMIEQKLQIQ